MSRVKTKGDGGAFGSLERDLTPENDHRSFYHSVYDIHIIGFRPWEFLVAQIWKLQEDRLVVGYSSSLEHADFPLRPQFVRATS